MGESVLYILPAEGYDNAAAYVNALKKHFDTSVVASRTDSLYLCQDPMVEIHSGSWYDLGSKIHLGKAIDNHNITAIHVFSKKDAILATQAVKLCKEARKIPILWQLSGEDATKTASEMASQEKSLLSEVVIKSEKDLGAVADCRVTSGEYPKLGDKIRIAFKGTIGEKTQLMKLVESFVPLRYKAHLLIIGQGKGRWVMPAVRLSRHYALADTELSWQPFIAPETEQLPVNLGISDSEAVLQEFQSQGIPVITVEEMAQAVEKYRQDPEAYRQACHQAVENVRSQGTLEEYAKRCKEVYSGKSNSKS